MFKKLRSKRVLYARVLTPALLALFAVISILATTALLPAKVASAAASDTTINFQARLLTSSGGIVPDGTYNVEFKLYNAATSSGSSQGSCSGDANCVWVETRTSTNQVTVKGGYLSVALGSVTAFPSTINWDQNLWLTMNIGDTGGSPTWDGEMTPRLAVTSVPYAFRAGELASLAGSNEATLQFAASFGQATNITLPDPGASSATICYQTATACGFAVGSGTAFLQGGNSFGVAANLGTSDVNVLNFQTNNVTRLTLDTSGNLTFAQASTLSTSTGNLSIQANGTSTLALDTSGAGTVSVANSNATTLNLAADNVAHTIHLGDGGSSTTQTVTIGSSGGSSATTITGGSGNLTLTSGTSTGGIDLTTNNASSSIIFQSQVNSTTAFQVQNASGTNLLNINTTGSGINVDGLAAPGTVTASVAPAAPTITVTGSTASSTTYTYEVVGVVANGASTYSSPTTTKSTLDATALTATNFNTVSWTSTGASEYYVYRTVSGGTGTSATTGLIGATTSASFADTGQTANGSAPTATAASLSNGTTYYFKVTALDGTGGQTTASTEVSKAASTATNDAITLSWAPVTGARSYHVYYATATGTEANYFTTSSNSYTMTTTTGNTAGSPPTTNTAYNNTLNTSGNSQLTLGNTSGSASSAQLDVAGNVPSAAVSTITTGTLPASVYVQGNYAYVINTTSNTFTIYNISNPASPVQEATTTACGFSFPAKVYVQGSYAYLLCSGAVNYLGIDNISNPANPYSSGIIQFAAAPTALYVQGNYAYVGSGSSLIVVNLVNVALPVVASSIPVLGTTPSSVYVQGNYAYLAFSGGNIIYIFNVSNPYSISAGGTINTGTGTAPSSVYVQGSYAYVTNSTSGTLTIYDTSNLLTPVLVGSVSTGTTPSSVYVQGHYAYVTNSGTPSLQVVDVSNPAAPFSMGSVTTGAGPNSLFVAGRYAYVTNGTAGALQIFDLGGAYIQQLQAGGLETGTLSVDSDTTLNGDVAIGGGLTISGSSHLSSDLGVAGTTYLQGSTVVAGGILGGATISGLTTPSAPTISFAGTTGTTATWSYEIVAVGANGGTTPASLPGSITSSDNATLSGSNYNYISWNGVSGAVSYKVYRTAVGASPTTTGLIGTTSGTNLSDKALAGDSTTPPTLDTSGLLTVNGPVTFKDDTNSTTAFQIQNASGSSILSLDTTSTSTGILTIAGTAANITSGSGEQVSTALNSTSNPQYGLLATPTITPASASTQFYAGVDSTPVSSSNNLTAGVIAAFNGGVDYGGTGTLGSAYGIDVQNDDASTGSITNSFGVQIGSPIGNITNNTALNISYQSSGTSNYAIVAAGPSTLPILSINGTGKTTFENSTDTTAGFVVENHSSLPLLTVDTFDGYVQVGSSTANTNTALLRLNNYSNLVTEPTEVDGAMYFNSFTNKFRCGESGVWENCVGSMGSSNTAASSALNGNTTTIQNFSTTATVNMGYCIQGRVLRIIANGVYTTTTTAESLTFTIRFGTTTIGVASPALTPAASITNAAWNLQYTIICDAAIGTSVAITGEGYANVFPAATANTTALNVLPMEATSSTGGINTSTANNTINVSATFGGTASASNTITLEQLIVQGQ